MKPIAGAQYKTEGTLSGESIEFGFDSNSLAHLQSILSDVYSNPTAAVIRELSTNALDAQIDAGYVGPIEVTTPNALSPTLTVIDHGVGMSIDDLHNIYTKYGASTKRNSNDVVGMLGIGSKSPLAISSQFSITTVRDGVKIVAMVKKNDQGIGELIIIDTMNTDEPSGTTIKVPAGDRHWREITNNIFRFWEPGTVLVDGVEPKTFYDSAEKIDDDLYVSSDLENDFLIMGNIAYPIIYDSTEGLFSRHHYYSPYQRVVVRVPIGSVQFAPSREELNYSDATVSFLDSLARDIRSRITKYVEETMDTIDTPENAFHFYMRWHKNRFGSSASNVWRGNKIPALFAVNGYMWERLYSRRARTSSLNSVHLSYLLSDNYFYITGWETGRAPTQSIKRRLTYYTEKNGLSLDKNFVFIDKFDDPVGWLANVDQVSVAELKAMKMPVNKSTGRVSTTARTHDWDMLTENGTVPLETNPSKYVYLSTTCKSQSLSHLARIAEIENMTVIVAGRNRWERLAREMPGGIHVDKWLNQLAETIKFTELEQYALAARVPGVIDHIVKKHDNKLTKIEDAELLRQINLYRNSRNLKTRNIRLTNLLSNYSISHNLMPIFVGSDYKLLDPMYSWNMSGEQVDHVIAYINAIHSQKNVES